MAGLRSHTREELVQAQKEGKTIWALDTGENGYDDILIMYPGEEEDDLWWEITTWFGGDVPEHWKLTPVGWDI